MAWGDVATWVSGLATVAAVVFAGLQVRMSRQEQEHERDLERRSIALSWQPILVPTDREADADGRITFLYEFVLHNAGRLAVTDVSAEVTFTCDVERILHDRQTTGPKRTMRLDTPVVAGGTTRPWRRQIRLALNDRERLRETTAVVTFRDLEGETRSTRWGRGPG